VRRVLIALVSLAAGAGVSSFFNLSARGGMAATLSIALALYGLADRFGLIPSAFEPRTWDILRTDSGANSRTADELTPVTVTVGVVLKTAEHQPPSSLVQRCLLCEAAAAVEVDRSASHIECKSCGQYCASLDAAHALGALVMYRGPVLAQMRQMLATYRQRHPDRVPNLHVSYVVSGTTTFGFSDGDSSRTD